MLTTISSIPPDFGGEGIQGFRVLAQQLGVIVPGTIQSGVPVRVGADHSAVQGLVPRLGYTLYCCAAISFLAVVSVDSLQSIDGGNEPGSQLQAHQKSQGILEMPEKCK